MMWSVGVSWKPLFPGRLGVEVFSVSLNHFMDLYLFVAPYYSSVF